MAKLLSREDMDISLIDERQDRLGDLDANYDLLTKVGSPTSINDLKNIGVEDVDLFIAVTDSDELNLLLESGVFGRDFCLYLRDLIAPGIQPDPTNIELNVEILYHAFGIFGVLQNLLAIRAEPELTGEIYRTGIDKLLKIVGDYAEDAV